VTQGKSEGEWLLLGNVLVSVCEREHDTGWEFLHFRYAEPHAGVSRHSDSHSLIVGEIELLPIVEREPQS